ncbi:hypothetical protein [Streptomyces sp. SD31]|uniref:hypothetical protein n=1 Tax=Streptomyces sp. SD31 TaxID=3452208 RepID=UPI003F8A652C
MVEQLLVELLVHGWDLATALGLDRDPLPDIARAALPVVREIYGELPRTAGGSIAPVRPVPEHAQALDRVAAFLGRRVPEERTQSVRRLGTVFGCDHALVGCRSGRTVV